MTRDSGDEDEFESSMRRFRRMRGSRCRFEPCEIATPEYSMLSDRQLDYYLWWRDRLSDGEVLRAQRGYVWLLVCEAINTEDPRQSLRLIAFMRDHAEELGLRAGEMDRVAADLCISGGMKMPSAGFWDDDVARGMMASETMWNPARMDSKRLAAFVGERRADELAGHLAEFSRILSLVDTSDFIAETRTVERDLFPGYRWFGPARFLVTYDVYNLGLQQLIDSIIAYLNGKKVQEPFKKIVRDALSGRNGPFQTSKKTSRGSIRMPVPEDVPRMADEAAAGAEEGDCVPVEGPDGPSVQYVPSGSARPDHRRFSSIQKRFYAQWSSEADAGRYLDTDTGYIWMRLCGLVNSDSDLTQALGRLTGMFRAYPRNGYTDIIRRTCIDFALKNRLPIPDSAMAEDDREASMVVEQYLRGCMDAKPDKDVLLRIAGLLGTDVYEGFDSMSAEVMRRTLMTANTELLKSGRADAVSVCRKSVFRRTLYEGLAYYRSDRRKLDMAFEYADFAGDPEMRRTFSDLARQIYEEPGRIERGLPRMALSVFGVREEDLVEFLLTGALSDRKTWDGSRSEIRLDPDAVRRAASDLDDVTMMMKTEGLEDSEEPVRPCMGPDDADDEPQMAVQTPSSTGHEMTDIFEPGIGRRRDGGGSAASRGHPIDDLVVAEQKGRVLKPPVRGDGPPADPFHDPWEDFSSGLDGPMAAYLRSAMTGCRPDLRMEAAINSLSMDTVGDTVVEDGAVVEDYIEEVRVALEGR